MALSVFKTRDRIDQAVVITERPRTMPSGPCHSHQFAQRPEAMLLGEAHRLPVLRKDVPIHVTRMPAQEPAEQLAGRTGITGHARSKIGGVRARPSHGEAVSGS